ncbi:MAG: hypothetical protein COX54_01895, partial [Candidatus Yonathbacteria bacterium CG23_combo_of_CG06-09_8_20_14_all_46_18]
QNYGVGVGSTTPYSKLSVTGTTGSTRPVFTVASSTGAEFFSVLYDGKVGIGTTTSAINNTLVVAGGVCITGGATCPAVSAGALSVDTAGVAGGDDPGDVFDVAERYPASEMMQAADIAAIDVSATERATVKRAVEGDPVIGIVSTKAAIAINGGELVLGPDAEATSTKPLIALQGRVPVRVTLEGGTIGKGDRITASSLPGVGRRATTSSYTVGIALENFTSSSRRDEQGVGTVLVFVNLGWSKLDPAIEGDALATLDGTGESAFWAVDQSSGRIKFITALDLNGFDIENVSAIRGTAGAWSIDASGRFVAREVVAERLCLGSTCVDETQLKALLGGAGVLAPTVESPATDPTTTPSVASDTPAGEGASSTADTQGGASAAQSAADQSVASSTDSVVPPTDTETTAPAGADESETVATAPESASALDTMADSASSTAPTL